MELDEMELAYPFLCTKVNPSFIVHIGLVWGKRLFYELRKHILTTHLKEDLTTTIEEAYTDS